MDDRPTLGATWLFDNGEDITIALVLGWDDAHWFLQDPRNRLAAAAQVLDRGYGKAASVILRTLDLPAPQSPCTPIVTGASGV